jgi:hypothetical protein
MPRQEPVMAIREPSTAEPMPTLTQALDVRMAAPDTGFKFDKPKSQSEALAERGIQDRAMKMHTPVIEDPKERTSGKTKKTKTTKGRKTKAAKAQDNALLGDDWDKGLPSTRVSGPGAVQVRSITTATPEEAAAASHFKGF